MTSYTTNEIKKYSTDTQKSNALLALMDYYGKDCLMKISEEQALAFFGEAKERRNNDKLTCILRFNYFKVKLYCKN